LESAPGVESVNAGYYAVASVELGELGLGLAAHRR
jgi:hypothetical protein